MYKVEIIKSSEVAVGDFIHTPSSEVLEKVSEVNHEVYEYGKLTESTFTFEHGDKYTVCDGWVVKGASN